jgi:hypothetical protein
MLKIMSVFSIIRNLLETEYWSSASYFRRHMLIASLYPCAIELLTDEYVFLSYQHFELRQNCTR